MQRKSSENNMSNTLIKKTIKKMNASFNGGSEQEKAVKGDTNQINTNKRASLIGGPLMSSPLIMDKSTRSDVRKLYKERDKDSDNFDDLDSELKKVKDMNKLCFIEVLSSIGARDDLGRPTTTALENKENFMKFLENI